MHRSGVLCSDGTLLTFSSAGFAYISTKKLLLHVPRIATSQHCANSGPIWGKNILFYKIEHSYRSDLVSAFPSDDDYDVKKEQFTQKVTGVRVANKLGLRSGANK